MIRLFLTLVLIAFATQGDASLIVVSGGAGSAESGGGSSGWVEGTAAASEEAGAISALPYVDMFSTNPITGGRTQAGNWSGATLTWSSGGGWNGENALVTSMPTGGDEDNCVMESKDLPGTSIRRLHMGFMMKHSGGFSDTKLMFVDRYLAGERLAGGKQLNLQGLNYSSSPGDVGGPAGGYLQLPMLNVDYSQMPFVDANNDDYDDTVTDTWMWHEVGWDLDTGIIRYYVCIEGAASCRLATAYQIYDPPYRSEPVGGNPAVPDTVDTYNASEYIKVTGWNGGGYPYCESVSASGQDMTISHHRIDVVYIGPPAGVVTDASEPTVIGEAYTTYYQTENGAYRPTVEVYSP